MPRGLYQHWSLPAGQGDRRVCLPHIDWPHPPPPFQPPDLCLRVPETFALAQPPGGSTLGRPCPLVWGHRGLRCAAVCETPSAASRAGSLAPAACRPCTRACDLSALARRRRHPMIRQCTFIFHTVMPHGLDSYGTKYRTIDSRSTGRAVPGTVPCTVLFVIDIGIPLPSLMSGKFSLHGVPHFVCTGRYTLQYEQSRAEMHAAGYRMNSASFELVSSTQQLMLRCGAWVRILVRAT